MCYSPLPVSVRVLDEQLKELQAVVNYSPLPAIEKNTQGGVNLDKELTLLDAQGQLLKLRPPVVHPPRSLYHPL